VTSYSYVVPLSVKLITIGRAIVDPLIVPVTDTGRVPGKASPSIAAAVSDPSTPVDPSWLKTVVNVIVIDVPLRVAAIVPDHVPSMPVESASDPLEHEERVAIAASTITICMILLARITFSFSHSLMSILHSVWISSSINEFLSVFL